MSSTMPVCWQVHTIMCLTVVFKTNLDTLSFAVADLTVMLALMAMRRAKEGMDIIHQGRVSPSHNFLAALPILD